VLRAVIMAGLYLVLASLLAFSLGLIIRHTAGTIGAYVTILPGGSLSTFALPSNWQHAIDRYLPLNMGTAMESSITPANSFTPWAATGVLDLVCRGAAGGRHRDDATSRRLGLTRNATVTSWIYARPFAPREPPGVHRRVRQ
jgi:hypothetical protein